ncbi:MAG: hypothetical protein ACK5NK_11080 [Niabella sp.]
MNNIVNNIATSVLSKNIRDCSIAELTLLAEEYPYSGALQLLYAKKLNAETTDKFAGQWQKTLLYFNNPLMVQQLTDNNTETIHTPLSPHIAETQKPKGLDILVPATENTKTHEDHEELPPINIPGLKIEPIDPEKAAFNYTPYYTVDYFASQGIQLSDEAAPTDKFGNQLKSFTSWLRQMRRLPETEIGSQFTLAENQKIEKMADNSLTGENAITEAMAKVWIKQNIPEKAIDIYKKLSLQNPAKSAFFAAKIEHLKKQL